MYLWPYTAISRKIVGKSSRDNPESYFGWFWVHCSSEELACVASVSARVRSNFRAITRLETLATQATKEFQRMARKDRTNVCKS